MIKIVELNKREIKAVSGWDVLEIVNVINYQAPFVTWCTIVAVIIGMITVRGRKLGTVNSKFIIENIKINKNNIDLIVSALNL